MRIGLFGGAFNPIHYGHLRTAEEVLETFSLDRIVFLPSGKPPFEKPDLAKASHRYEMTRMAVEDNPHFEVSDIEIRTRGRSYSVNTVTRLRKMHRDAEFYFILGIDAFLDLPEWEQPDRLISLTNLVVISRPGCYFADVFSSPYLKNISKRRLKELDKGDRTVLSFNMSGGKRCFLCRVTGLDISASLIRGMIKAGREVKYLLPDSVKSYIMANKLYLGNRSRKRGRRGISCN